MTKFRRWIATNLVLLARRIDPKNKQVMQFWTDRMMEFVITGQSNIKIDYVSTNDPFQIPPDTDAKL